MNQKGLLFIAVLSLMLIAANGMKVAHKPKHSKDSEQVHRIFSKNLHLEQFKVTLNGKVIKLDSNTLDGKFVFWVKDNAKLMKALEKSQELSPEDSEIVAKFVKADPALLSHVISLDDQKFITCKKTLTPQSLKDLDARLLKQVQFKKVFSSSTWALTTEKYQNVVKQIEKDNPVYGKSFVSCARSSK